MWDDVKARLKKENRLLFDRDSVCLRELRERIAAQTHRALVLWALDCARVPLGLVEERYPGETRPRAALELCDLWARGAVKMPAAKRAILECHAAAKEMEPVCGALCHGIGQAGGTVHVETHAIGLPLYELTAIVLRHGGKDYEEEVLLRLEAYGERLSYWQEEEPRLQRPWAAFLRDDARPNKERLLLDAARRTGG